MEDTKINKIHPELYTYFSNTKEWEEKFLRPEILTGELDLYIDEELTNIYTIPFFSEEFCDAIIDEAESCNCWTVDRHESYPTTDMTMVKSQNCSVKKGMV